MLFTGTINPLLLNSDQTHSNEHNISPLTVKLLRHSTAWRQYSTWQQDQDKTVFSTNRHFVNLRMQLKSHIVFGNLVYCNTFFCDTMSVRTSTLLQRCKNPSYYISDHGNSRLCPKVPADSALVSADMRNT